MRIDAKPNINFVGRVETGVLESYSGLSWQDQERTLVAPAVAKSHFAPGVIRVVGPVLLGSCVAADQRKLCSLPDWQSFFA